MNIVHLLWFVKERPEGEEDIELLIGVYASESTAKAAIQRLKGQRGFIDFPEGFQIHPHEIDKDHWREGYILD